MYLAGPRDPSIRPPPSASPPPPPRRNFSSARNVPGGRRSYRATRPRIGTRCFALSILDDLSRAKVYATVSGTDGDARRRRRPPHGPSLFMARPEPRGSNENTRGLRKASGLGAIEIVPRRAKLSIGRSATGLWVFTCLQGISLR